MLNQSIGVLYQLSAHITYVLIWNLIKQSVVKIGIDRPKFPSVQAFRILTTQLITSCLSHMHCDLME